MNTVLFVSNGGWINFEAVNQDIAIYEPICIEIDWLSKVVKSRLNYRLINNRGYLLSIGSVHFVT